ncbi:MAG: S-layer homology domain-containing protein [Clostridia bacterium]|nr:S-layer homology domain-containing protein [Clostridia bacterium]
MKKIFKAFISLTMVLSMSLEASAGITIYNELGTIEEMSVELCDLSVAKSMSKDDAKFVIHSYIESGGVTNYDVTYEIDGVVHNAGTLTAKPYEHQSTKFSFGDIDNGIYYVTINVKDGSRVAATLSERLVIMDGYEHQFMDELSTYGMNVHLNQSQSRDYDPIEIDRLQFAGTKKIREAVEWRHVEKTRGTYDFKSNTTSATSTRIGHDAFYNVLQDHGIDHYRILGYGNPNYLHFPGDDPDDILGGWNERGLVWWGGGFMPNVPDGLVGWKNYVKESVAHWGSDNDYEIFNETFLAKAFPENVGNANANNNLIKFSTMGKIETGVEGYNADINCFSIGQSVHWQLTEGLKQGIYPYINTAATHTYVHPSDPDRNDSFRREIEQVRQDFVDLGGWKDINLSEFGWCFREDGELAYPMVSDEFAALCLVKNFILADDVNVGEKYYYAYAKYRLKDEELQKLKDGTVVDSEQQFGLFDVFYNPQKPYLTYTELNRRLGGAVYLGEVSLGIGDGERAFLYTKDGEPLLVIWYYDGNDGTASYSFNEDVEVYDIYGNDVYKGNGAFEVSNSPLYVYGLSDEWFKKCAVENLKDLNKSYIANSASEFDSTFSKEIGNIMNNTASYVEADTTDDTVLSAIKTYAELGDTIIAKAAKGEVTQLVASKTLFRLYEIMCMLDNMYIALYDGEMPAAVESDIAPLTEKVNKLYRNDKRLMQYTDEMYRHAKRFVDNANTVFGLENNPQKAGVIKAYDLMAGIVIRWADEFSDFEDVIRYGVFTQIPYADTVTTSGFTTKINMSVFNYENNDINAYVLLKDGDGNVVAQTDTALIKAGEYITVPVSFVIDKEAGVDSYYYTTEVYDESGEYISSTVLGFSVGDNMGVTMKPLSTTPDETTNLTFAIKNMSGDELDLKLNVKSTDDITFGQSSVNFHVDANAETEVNVPIVSMKDTAYHFYTADYSVQTAAGEEIYSGVYPISFTNIVKAKDKIDVANYDGTLDGWEDAYPIYINPPKTSDNASSWQGANLAARIMYKWDEDNLYILADAYDNRLYNALSRSDMWNGDCIQMTFDVNNNKTTAYDATDIELGFAATTLGNAVHVWQSPTAYSGSETPEWLQIIRNDDLNLTRYVAAIPKNVLQGINFTAGSKFGYNVGFNEADTLYRDTWYQLTNGTIDSKNPSHYETFTFVDSTNKELLPSLAESIFADKLENVAVKLNPFTDVYGHWAENQITSLYGIGVINGMTEDKFVPSGTLTRAEFMQMAALVSGKTTGESYSIYDDVAADDWYAEAIQILYENDIIPADMISDNNICPNKEITREEAAVIASNVYKAVKSKTVKTGTLEKAPDADAVSEWAIEAVDKAMTLGIIVGDENGYVNPTNLLTRAEGAAIVFKLNGVLQ